MRPRGTNSTACWRMPKGSSLRLEIGAKREAIEASRLLLIDPDPVAPLLSASGELLRHELKASVADLTSEYTRDEWRSWKRQRNGRQLGESDRSLILAEVGTHPGIRPDGVDRFGVASPL